MKKELASIISAIVMIACLSLLFLPVAARAEAGLVSFGITNSIAASATNTSATTVGNAVKIDNQETVALYYSGKLNGAGTSAQTFIVARSLDGVTPESQPFSTNTVTMSGTAAITKFWQLQASDIASTPYLMVTSVGNANASVGTNHTFGVIKKVIK